MFRVIIGALLGMAITPAVARFSHSQVVSTIKTQLENMEVGYQPDALDWKILFFFCTAMGTIIGAMAGGTWAIQSSIRKHRVPRQ